jgi:hypothetical protein
MAVLSAMFPARAADWQQIETGRFRYLFQGANVGLVPQVDAAANATLDSLERLFDYRPSEVITVVLRDYRDVGAARATALPHNTVTIDIAPFAQADYETIRFADPIVWMLSHELVHIAVSDQGSLLHKRFRRIFGKVMPQKQSPLTLPFSLLTNPGRFTPNWYQEGIAVFMETWFGGGHGRLLGSYDEMYFRSLAWEAGTGTPSGFLDHRKVDDNDGSFLLGSTAYLYGGRFMAYLATEYGWDALRRFTIIGEEHGGYPSFGTRFRRAFGMSLDGAWQNFQQSETIHQHDNLARLETYPFSDRKALSGPMGWVGKPHLADGDILFASFRPDAFAAIERLNLASGDLESVVSLPTPGFVRVASTAYDVLGGRLFFTTHNNMGYRDLWMSDRDGKKRLITDGRVGELAFDPTHDMLWGVQARGAVAALVAMAAPFDKITQTVGLPFGTQLSHLAVSPDGRRLLATLRDNRGQQSLVLIDLEVLRESDRIVYTTLVDQGSPEFGAWGQDGETVFWNATLNGVSNIYRRKLSDPDFEAVSNVPTGLFRPLDLGDGRLFAFEYSSDGFVPVIVPNKTVAGLAAIRFRGQDVIEKNTELKALTLDTSDEPGLPDPVSYDGLASLQKTTLIPTVASFAGQTAVGAFFEMRDPLGHHRVFVDAGLSSVTDVAGNWHLDAGYEYRDILQFGFRHQPTSFYDLANQRNVRRANNNLHASYKKYWVFDRPHEVTQQYFASWNQWRFDDFGATSNEKTLSMGTRFAGKMLRKTIGAVDFEKGLEWDAEIKHTRRTDDFSVHSSWVKAGAGWRTPVGTPHNVLAIKLDAGVSWGDFIGEGRFYFGGFGKPYLEEASNRRYRQQEQFPGFANQVQVADRFAKLTVENRFPAVDVGWDLGPAFLKTVDVTLFHQQLYSRFSGANAWTRNIGVQLNGYLKNIHVMDATISLGLARAWDKEGRSGNELFLYVKLFRN